MTGRTLSLTLDEAACVLAFGNRAEAHNASWSDAKKTAFNIGRAELVRALEAGMIVAIGFTIAEVEKPRISIPPDAWVSGPIWERSALIIDFIDYQVRLDLDAVRALAAELKSEETSISPLKPEAMEDNPPQAQRRAPTAVEADGLVIQYLEKHSKVPNQREAELFAKAQGFVKSRDEMRAAVDRYTGSRSRGRPPT